MKPKFKVGDVLKRKNEDVTRLVTKIELGSYELSDDLCPTSLRSCELDFSIVEKNYDFVRHMNTEEYK